MTEIQNSIFENLHDVIGVPYHRAIHSKDILDMYVLRAARRHNLRLPTGGEPNEAQFHGAFVGTPHAGMNNHDIYLDLSSLYPNAKRALNLGPDTIVGTKEDLEQSPWTEDDCIWSYIDTRDVKYLKDGESYCDFTDGTYKMVYDPSSSEMKWRGDPQMEKCYYLHPDVREGFIRSTVQNLIDMKDEYDGDTYEAVKAFVTNAYWGYMNYLTKNTSSRLAEWRLGESITLWGRTVIKWTIDRAIEWFDDRGYDAHLSRADTDGAGISVPDADSREEVLSVGKDFIEWINTDGYAEFCHEQFGVDKDEHFMELELEKYCPRVFVPRDFKADDEDVGVRKRYAEHRTWEDGEGHDTISITGMEAVRSDVAPITGVAQRRILEPMLRNGVEDTREEVYTYLKGLHEDGMNGDLSLTDVAKRGGIGQDLHEYGSQNRRPQPRFRGAKYADKFIEGVHLSEGSKPMAVYVDEIRGDSLPPTYEAVTAEDGDVVDCIAVEDASDLPNDVVVDWERHTKKAIVSPMEPILKTVGWSWTEILESHTQSSFADF